MKTQIGIFGLGRMGGQIARRLHKNGFDVLGWNRSAPHREEAAKAGVKVFDSVEVLIGEMKGTLTPRPPLPKGEGGFDKFASRSTPRIFWLMVPPQTVGEFLDSQLGPHLKPGDIIIDGGNSFYKDSIARAKMLAEKGIIFYDCGTSGGIWGEANGFALMV